MTDTSQLVARLRELSAKANIGPLRVVRFDHDDGDISWQAQRAEKPFEVIANLLQSELPQASAVAELLVELATSLPALLDAVERANEVVGCDLCGAPCVSTCVRCGERYATTAEAVACEKAEVPLGRNDGKTTVDGPELHSSAIADTGDCSVTCSVCGEERDEPHSWRECTKQLQREIVRLLDALCDTEVREELERLRAKNRELRARVLEARASHTETMGIFGRLLLVDDKYHQRSARLMRHYSTLIREGREPEWMRGRTA